MMSLALLRLERAGAIDEHAARLGRVRPRGRAAGAAGPRAWRCRPARLSQGMSGWRRMVPVDGARRIEQHGVERPRLPFARRRPRRSRPRGRGGRDFRAAASSRAGARSTAVTCAPASGELRGLAAGRGAKIGDRAAAHVAEQPRRQRRGRVLHPPRAFGKARQRRHRPCGDRAHRAGRQHAAAKRRRPVLRVGLDGEIERRLLRGWRPRSRARSRRRRSAIQRAISHSGVSSASGIERGEPRRRLRARSAAAPR